MVTYIWASNPISAPIRISRHLCSACRPCKAKSGQCRRKSFERKSFWAEIRGRSACSLQYRDYNPTKSADVTPFVVVCMVATPCSSLVVLYNHRRIILMILHYHFRVPTSMSGLRLRNFTSTWSKGFFESLAVPRLAHSLNMASNDLSC
jgi:hypothetical protein